MQIQISLLHMRGYDIVGRSRFLCRSAWKIEIPSRCQGERWRERGTRGEGWGGGGVERSLGREGSRRGLRVPERDLVAIFKSHPDASILLATFSRDTGSSSLLRLRPRLRLRLRLSRSSLFRQGFSLPFAIILYTSDGETSLTLTRDHLLNPTPSADLLEDHPRFYGGNRIRLQFRGNEIEGQKLCL